MGPVTSRPRIGSDSGLVSTLIFPGEENQLRLIQTLRPAFFDLGPGAAGTGAVPPILIKKISIFSKLRYVRSFKSRVCQSKSSLFVQR